jgi:hypothetical protein
MRFRAEILRGVRFGAIALAVLLLVVVIDRSFRARRDPLPRPSVAPPPTAEDSVEHSGSANGVSFSQASALKPPPVVPPPPPLRRHRAPHQRTMLTHETPPAKPKPLPPVVVGSDATVTPQILPLQTGAVLEKAPIVAPVSREAPPVANAEIDPQPAQAANPAPPPVIVMPPEPQQEERRPKRWVKDVGHFLHIGRHKSERGDVPADGQP